MSEIARNSVLQSGYEHSQKALWLGEKYALGADGNDISKSNVPDIRLQFRQHSLNHERNFVQRIVKYLGSKVPPPAAAALVHHSTDSGSFILYNPQVEGLPAASPPPTPPSHFQMLHHHDKKPLKESMQTQAPFSIPAIAIAGATTTVTTHATASGSYEYPSSVTTTVAPPPTNRPRSNSNSSSTT